MKTAAVTTAVWVGVVCVILHFMHVATAGDIGIYPEAYQG